MTKITWQKLAADDFMAQSDGYTLRVERMNPFEWWWCVRRQDDVIADSTMLGEGKPTERAAKAAAVRAMHKHAKVRGPAPKQITVEAFLSMERVRLLAFQKEIRRVQALDPKSWPQRTSLQAWQEALHGFEPEAGFGPKEDK